MAFNHYQLSGGWLGFYVPLGFTSPNEGIFHLQQIFFRVSSSWAPKSSSILDWDFPVHKNHPARQGERPHDELERPISGLVMFLTNPQ